MHAVATQFPEDVCYVLRLGCLWMLRVRYLRPLPSRSGSPFDLLYSFSSGVLVRAEHKHWPDVADQSCNDDKKNESSS